MLSQIGCVTIPPNTLKDMQLGKKITDAEQKMIETYPAIGSELLAHIPRLESICRMIAQQQESFGDFSGPKEPEKRDQVILGAQMLKVALSYDELIMRRCLPHAEAIRQLLAGPEICDPEITADLQSVEIQDSGMESQRINLFDLNVHMILDEDIRTKNDVLLASKGQGVSPTLIKFLENYANRAEIKEDFQVLVLG